MGTIVDATVPTDQFALPDTFEAMSDVEFESVQVVAHESGQMMPFLWGSTRDLDRLDDALVQDSTTDSVQRLADCDGRRLYRIHWQLDVKVVLQMLVEDHGTLLGATGRNGHWALRVLFPDHQSISSTYEFCKEHGIDLSIRRVNGAGNLIDHGGIDLSEEQYEALTAAFETDYYDVPRGKTLEGLSELLEVSHQALSERLRRGHRNLIANTLCEGPDPVDWQP
jgi:predicted DNA binding protein